MYDLIETKIIEFLKKGISDKCQVYKDIKNRIQNHLKEKKLEQISDNDILSIVQKMIKTRNDTIAFAKKGNRQDISDKEQNEISILEELLPEQLSTTDIINECKIIKEQNNLDKLTIRDMGLFMKQLTDKFSNQFNKKLASQTVKLFISPKV